jgi:hypothetical protein
MNLKYHYKVNNINELDKLHLVVNLLNNNKNNSWIKQNIYSLLHLMKKTRYTVRKYEKNRSSINQDFISFFYNRNASHNNRYNNYSTIKNKSIISPIHLYKKVEYHNNISSFYRLKYQRNIEYDDIKNTVKISIIPATIQQTMLEFVKDCDLYEIEIDIHIINPNDKIYRNYIHDCLFIDTMNFFNI